MRCKQPTSSCLEQNGGVAWGFADSATSACFKVGQYATELLTAFRISLQRMRRTINFSSQLLHWLHNSRWA